MNAFLDKDLAPILIEAGEVGTPKMCGEFLAPHSLDVLDSWDIGPLQTVNHAEFCTGNKRIAINFHRSAAAFSRQSIELQLAQRARNKGATILTNSPVSQIEPPDKQPFYKISLQSNQEIYARTIVFATGRFAMNSRQSVAPYWGIKFHVPKIKQPNTLFMFSMNKSYFGLVPIEDNKSNCACLIKGQLPEKNKLTDYIRQIQKFYPELTDMFDQYESIDYLSGKSPGFKIKKNPAWQNSYWIGDALATYYPAMGLGFAHSISSAVSAVDYFLKNDAPNYHQMAQAKAKSQLRLGRIIHTWLLHPALNRNTPSTLTEFLKSYFMKRLEY